MSGLGQRIDNYISLKPVRLEDFRSSCSRRYPTPVQLVQHLCQLDQSQCQQNENYAGGNFSRWSNQQISSSKNIGDSSAAFLPLVPDWMNGGSIEDNETIFPWLQSPSQPVVQIVSVTDDIHFYLSEDEDRAESPSPTPSEDIEAVMEESGRAKRKKQRRIHTCGVCHKSYRLQSSLDKHLKTPCELRPYKCEICSKAFKRPDHLKAHGRMHTGERPFTCDLCEKSFRQKNHLQRHLERKHVKGKADEKADDVENDQDSKLSNLDVCHLAEDMGSDEIRTDERD